MIYVAFRPLWAKMGTLTLFICFGLSPVINDMDINRKF